MSSRLTTPVRVSFGLGAVGTGAFATVPGLLLLYYMTETLALPPSWAGWAAFAPKIWDLLLDPVVGVCSDRTRHRTGRRRPWLLAGALTLPPAFVAMFTTPMFASPELRLTWVIAAYTLAATAYAVFSVPHISMPAEMSDDRQETTALLSWRVGFMGAGILAAGAVAPLLVLAGGGGRPGYALMGVVIGLLLFVSLFQCWRGTASAPFAENLPPRAHHPLRELGQVLRNRPFVLLLAAYFLQIVGAGCILAVVPYYAKFVLDGDESTVTLLFLALVAPALLAMPIWVRAARVLGRRGGLGLSLLFFAGGCFALGIAGPTRVGVAVAIVAAAGIGWSGSQLFPYAMLPDVQRAESLRSGEPREGIMTGLWMSSDKAGLALGALLAGQILAITGFEEGGLAQQSPLALRGIIASVSMVPAAFFAASLVALGFYRTPEVPRADASAPP